MNAHQTPFRTLPMRPSHCLSAWILLACSLLPQAQAATITIDAVTCTMSKAIEAANNDSTASGACTAGSGDDIISIPVGTFVGAPTIPITSNITFQGASEATSIVTGDEDTDGTGDKRPFFVESGTVVFQDLTIEKGMAKGGDAKNGGGGGAGMGGAILIYDGDVSLINVTLDNNQAVGGLGKGGGKGGGGGMGGNGARVDGFPGAGGGGFYGNGAANASRGGGGGGLATNGSGTGTGGTDAFGNGAGSATGGNGGYGGGGGGNNSGIGGTGGFGGGGGGASSSSGSRGGHGGFGGGGGSGSSSSNGAGGNGGFGGGGGAAGSNSPTLAGGKGGFGGGGGRLNGAGGFAAGDNGGGGAGLGGAIFIRTGTLTLQTVTFSNNSTTGGAGNPTPTNDGQGLGGALFIMHLTTNTNANNESMPASLPSIGAASCGVSFSGNTAADTASSANDTNDFYIASGSESNVNNATTTVTSAADSGAGSLRNVIACAGNGSVITFDASLAGQTISLASQLGISKNLSIDGETNNITISGDSDSDGTGDVTIFNIDAGTISLRYLHLDKGTGAGAGSAVHISNTAVLTLEHCTVSNASSPSTHLGAITASDTSSLQVKNSVFYGNEAGFGGALGFGSDSSGEVINSSFYNNTSTASTGGGGAIYINTSGTVSILNSTFANNTATSTTNGGGVHFKQGTVHLKNSILANNNNGSGANDCVLTTASLASDVNNLIENHTGCGTPSTTSVPLLGSLQDNGGSVHTMALLPGSPAINAGDNTACADAGTVNNLDARGITRPQSTNCSIGAYEKRPPAFSSTEVTTATAGTAYTYNITTTDNETTDGASPVITAPTLPAWLSLTDNSDGTATLTGTPDGSDVGANAVVLSLNESTENVTQSFDVTVACVTNPVVTSNADSGANSLRWGIQAACSGDTVTFDADHTITLASDLTINKNLTIDGDPRTIRIDGNDSTPIFYVSSGSVDLKNLTLEKGALVNDHGAALYVGSSANVLLQYVLFQNNVVTGSGKGAAVYVDDGVLSVYSTVFFNNSSQTDGAAIYNTGSSALLKVFDSDFSNNTASGQGAALRNAQGTAHLISTSVYNNTATGHGGGVSNSGTLHILNSTLASNSTGVYSDGTLHLKNALVANSTSYDCNNTGTLSSNVRNLIEDGTCSPALTGDPLLGAYQDNGGSGVYTLALLPDSPAANAGDNTTCADATTVNNFDARGITRPQSTLCSIGAYEKRPPAFSSTEVTSATSGTAYTYNITTTDNETTDGASPVITAPTLPAWLSLTDNTDGTATLTGTPGFDDVGSHAVVLSLNENTEDVTQSFNITIPCVSHPIVTSNADSGTTSLRAAIFAACSGDTITFDADYSILLANPLSINKPLTIDGGSNNIAMSGDTDSNGTGDVPIFDVSAGNLSLESLTLSKGISTVGSAINVTNSASTLSINNCHFDNNTATGTVSGNRSGGAIYTIGPLTVTNSSFTSNTAYSGGAIYSSGTSLSVSDTDFSTNAANTGAGGGISFSGTTATINGGTFNGNQANGSTFGFGGAIATLSAPTDISVTGTVFISNSTNNSTDGGGGAINFGLDITGSVSNSTFTSNSTTQRGGALRLNDGANVSVGNSIFSANESNKNGGAISLQNEGNTDTVITVSHSLFENNKTLVSGYGGAIAQIAGTGSGKTRSHIFTSLFNGNQSIQSGGALQFSGVDSGQVINNTFIGNTATSSGGGVNLASAATNLSVVNNTFSGNSSAASQGGNINVDGILAVFSNNIIANNTGGGDCRIGTTLPGSITTNINNLIEDNTCSPALSGDPNLGALQNNGGSVQTMALLPDSPAANAGNNTACADAGTVNNLDARGITRPQSTNCSIGAYEKRPPVFSSTEVTAATAGTAYTYSITTTDNETTDGASPAITAPTKPAGLTLTDNGDGTATLTGTPLGVDVGSHSVTLSLNESTENVTQSFNITVACMSNPIVSNNADSGAGSLRDGIAGACSGDTVTFDADYSITLASELTLDKNLSIDGGANNITVSGNNVTRVFNVASGSINLNSLTISNGHAGAQNGGGIFVASGAGVTLSNSVMSNNTAAKGGAIESYAGALLLTINNSVFSGNGSSATHGGTLDLASDANIFNSTFYNNTASIGGAALNINPTYTITIKNSTFSDNSKHTIRSHGGFLALSNNIIANTTSGSDCYFYDASGGVTTNTNNLIEDGTCSPLVSSDPLLGALQDNGGTVHTMALLPNSPAANAGDNANCEATDARGITRPQSTNCSIGAYEKRPPAFSSTEVTAATAGTAYTYNITTTDNESTDGASPAITASTKPAWLTLTDNGDGTATLSGTPDGSDAGANAVVLSLNESTENVTQSFDVTVTCASHPVVTSSADTGTNSLRWAIQAACVGDTVTFDAGIAGSTIDISSSGQLDIDKDLSIDGSGQNMTVSGGGAVRVFSLGASTTIAFNSLTIADGSAASNSTGAGISGPDVTLTVENCLFKNNQAGHGGAIRVSGATLTVKNSIFYNNIATSRGGGILLGGDGGTLNIYNSTFSANSAPVSKGAGVYNLDASGTLNLYNNIFAGAVSGSDCYLQTGNINDNINNLFEDNSCNSGTTISGRLSGNPALGTLQDNGGSIHTLALLPGSPALNAGNNASCEATDARGITRPQSTNCSIGAYEKHPSAFSSTEVTSATSGTVYTYNISTTDNETTDGASPAITAPTKPAWLTLTDNGNGTATLTGTPDGSDAGVNAVVLSLNESTENVTQSFDVTVACASNPVVTSSADTGANSLRWAVGAACVGDTVTFDTDHTITLLSELDVNKDLTIDGGANNITITTASSIRLLDFVGTTTATLKALTLSNGNAGGIYGGAISMGTAINLTIEQCMLSDNTAARGGAINNSNGVLTVKNSVFANNTASSVGGGAVYNDNSSTLTVINSIFTGNSANGAGAAIRGGNASITLLNSTISGNSTSGSGGLHIGTGATRILKNTLIANNTGGDCSGTFLTHTNNLIKDGSCATNASSMVTGDPNLGTLQDNGGSMQTMALLPGSPAANAGDNASCEATDARGITRPQSTNCSIGAYEKRPPAFSSTEVTSVNEDAAYSYSITTTDNESTDGASPAITVPTKPTWLTFTDNGDGTATLSGTPTNAEVGTHNVVLSLNESTENVQQSFTVTVNQVNDQPSFTASNPATIDEDAGAQTLAGWATFDSGTDESDSVVAYTVSAISHSGLFSAVPAVDNSGTLTYTPAAAQNGTSTFDVTVQDDGGTANGGLDTSATLTFTITVNAVNDAPVLDFSGAPVLTDILEEDVASNGNLISEIIASVEPAVTMLSDDDPADTHGLAIFTTDESNGAWEYSLNNGSSWQAVGVVSASHARMLASDVVTRLRFVPNADYHGTAAINFRLWDKNDATVNGNTAAIISSGGATAFSADTEVAQITVVPVNDQPSFEYLSHDITHPIALSGAHTVPAWAFNIDLGSVDENVSQTPLFIVNVTDPTDILNDAAPPTVAANGQFTYTLNAGAGVATLEMFLQDNGGVTNGGVDMSTAASVTIGKGALEVLLSAGTAGEGAGAGAITGTVSRESSTQGDLTVSLASSDMGEATVPLTVVILDGELSATFAIDAMDDSTLDGTQSLTLTASAPGQTSGTAAIQVFDNERTLTMLVTGEGSVSPGPGEVVVTQGDSVQLSATPAAGWVFDGWSGCSSNGSVFINNNYTCTATFSQLSFNLTADITGGEGTVSGTGSHLSQQALTLTATPSAGWTLPVLWGGDCDVDGTAFLDADKHCTAAFTQQSFTLSLNQVGEGVVTGAGSYPSFTPVNISATPAAGWQFDGWDSACSTIPVNMDSDKTCTATFSRQSFNLTASVSQGQGQVSGAGSYVFGDTVQLSAAPESGWALSAWSGDCAANGSVFIDTDKHCTASFALQNFTLSASTNGQGQVSGTGGYVFGDTAQLSATADTGWTFKQWSGDCDSQGAVVMNTDKQCAAHFERQSFNVSATINGQGDVEGAGSYLFEDVAQLIPTPAEGWQFDGWAGDCDADGQVTVTTAITCEAIFSEINNAITLTVNISGQGSVTGDGEYAFNDSAFLTATPASEWFFLGWSGDCLGDVSKPFIGVLMDDSKTCGLSFTQDTFILTVDVTGQGRVDGQGQYPPFTDILLKAVRQDGWLFTGWGGDCTTSGEVTLNSDKHCTATFEPPPDPDAPNQVAAVPVENFAALTPESIATVPPTMLNQLNSEQLAAIPPAAFSQLSASQLANLGTEAVAGITPDQVASLPPEALSDLNGDSLQALATDTIEALSPEQVDALNETEVQNMPSTEVSELMVNLNAGTIDPIVVVDMLPEGWGIDLATGDLSAPSGTAITYQTLDVQEQLPTQVSLANVPDLNSGFSLGGEGSKGSALSNMQTSLDLGNAGSTPSTGTGGTDNGTDPGTGGTDNGTDPGTGGTDNGTDPGTGGTDNGTDPGTGGTDNGTNPGTGGTDNGTAPGTGGTDNGTNPGTGGTDNGSNPGTGGTDNGTGSTGSGSGGGLQSQFNLSQKSTGILKVSATFDSRFEMAFVPDPNNIIVVNDTTPIGLAVDEGGFTIVITPSGESFRVLPAPANPEAFPQALGADSNTQVTADGSVFFDYADSTRRRGRARQVATFQSFVEPAPDAFICMAFCGIIPPEQLAPEYIPTPDTPQPEGCLCDPALFPPELQPGMYMPPPGRRIDSFLPTDNQNKATFVYPDGRAQTLNPALLEPDEFKSIGEQYEGVEKVVRNANGTFTATAAGRKYLLKPVFDVQVNDNVSNSDDTSIQINNEVLEFHVPFDTQTNDARRRGRARQVVVFQPVVEFIPEEFCSLELIPERRICQFGEQFCEELLPGDWRCELNLEAFFN